MNFFWIFLINDAVCPPFIFLFHVCIYSYVYSCVKISSIHRDGIYRNLPSTGISRQTLKFTDRVITGAKVYNYTRIHWFCNAPNYFRYKYVNSTASNDCFNFINIFIIMCFRVSTWVPFQQLFYKMQPAYLWRRMSICLSMSWCLLSFCYWMSSAWLYLHKFS